MRGFSEEDVRLQIALLETIFSDALQRTLVAVFYAAWRTLTGSILKFIPDCPTRVRRNVFWALLLSEARVRFGENSEILFKETKQGHYFVQIPGQTKGSSVLIRFKFLRQDLLTSNYPTQGSLQYDRQIPLAEIPQGIRVNVGYRPNQDETSLDGVFAVWAIGSQKLWMKQLESADPATLVPLPLSAAASRKPTSQPRRTKVKDDLFKKKDNKDDPNADK
jgi:hypothetical protein